MLDYDGDYVNVFLDSDKNIVDRFVISSDGVRSKIIEIAKKEKTSTSNITWPRHADGSCDYDDDDIAPATADAPATEERTEEIAEPAEATILKSAPAIGKTAVVAENLRLRTDYDTTAEVVATLAAGTRVQVHLLGKEDTIDAIKSNWVWVETLVSAKDKDGNTVEAGTKGWLFGGYLSETESAESESQNEDDVGAKKSSALPIVPIAAGGAALAVLLAVVLLVVKKRKASRE